MCVCVCVCVCVRVREREERGRERGGGETVIEERNLIQCWSQDKWPLCCIYYIPIDWLGMNFFRMHVVGQCRQGRDHVLFT